MDDGPPDVVKVAPLDASLIELARADRAGDTERVGAAITNLAWAWVRLDEREQASKLHYFKPDRRLGAILRNALKIAASEYDLGMAGSNYAAVKGRPWH